ncbi:MAG: hypothetical protein M9890_12730 [Thermomicrobiales bacterium]|nr:hypothetical protein [Thermomicrobiales bacterium]
MHDLTGMQRPAREHTGPRDTPSNAALDLQPASVFEVVTRQMVDDLIREVSATRQRVDALFYLVIAAVLGDILSRLA